MTPQQIRWGTAILHLDQQDWLQVSDLASTVLCGDCNAGQRFRFDKDDLSHPLRLLGTIVGYMSGPLHPETMAEQAERLKDAVVWHETPSDGLSSLLLRQ
jgi:hypothetical protein